MLFGGGILGALVILFIVLGVLVVSTGVVIGSKTVMMVLIFAFMYFFAKSLFK